MRWCQKGWETLTKMEALATLPQNSADYCSCFFHFFSAWMSLKNHCQKSPWEVPADIKRQTLKNNFDKKIQVKTLYENHQVHTFDIEITPSKFIALFLAVNRSSLHPEISSWTYTKNEDIIKFKTVRKRVNCYAYKFRWKVLSNVLFYIFFPLRNILLAKATQKN